MRGFKLGLLSEYLLEFDKCSKPLGHHGQLYFSLIVSRFWAYWFWPSDPDPFSALWFSNYSALW